MKVQVYKCLGGRREHKGSWSIRDKQSGLVVAHADIVTLSNAKFHVQQGGRKRVVETGSKNVHAWVEGELVSFQGTVDRFQGVENYASSLHAFRSWTLLKYAQRATYNPLKYQYFVDEQKMPVFEARTVVLNVKAGLVVFRPWDVEVAA